MTTETTVSAAQPADPWGAAAQTTTTADPWSTGSDAATASNDWLNTAPTDVPFDWMHPFKDAILPFDSWVETALNWLVTHGRQCFRRFAYRSILFSARFKPHWSLRQPLSCC